MTARTAPTVDRRLLEAATPRLNHYIAARPTPRQAAFLLVPSQEAFYGGAAGGGKSSALLMGAMQYVDVPGYAALLVRETYQMLQAPNGLMDLANRWLSGTDAIWNAGEHQWRFPSGSTLTFRHMQDAGSERNFQGAEYQFIGIDEVTDFTESQYRFLFSRLRRTSASEIPLRMRSASNPVGKGREWCHRRFVLDTAPGAPVFIPAWLEDNPHLDRESYEGTLRRLTSVEYQQLRHGDWNIRSEGGLFHDAWFDNAIDRRELPEHLRLCRAWDLAATEPIDGSDPDFTAGVLLGRADGITYVIDVKRMRASPLKIERLIRTTADADAEWAKERRYTPPTILMEQEPGSAGKAVIEHYRREVLSEYSFKGERATGTKESRAMPVAARAESKELVLCRGQWNAEFLNEIVSFPLSGHDDQVDALSAAFGFLAKHREHTLVMPVGLTRPSHWRDDSGYDPYGW